MVKLLGTKLNARVTLLNAHLSSSYPWTKYHRSAQCNLSHYSAYQWYNYDIIYKEYKTY